MVADEADDVALGQPLLGHVLGADEQDVARALHAAEPVVIAVDRGVELIVRAQRDQAEPAGHVGKPRRVEMRRHRELGPAARRVEVPVARPVALVEAARCEHPVVEIVEEIGIGRGDRVAYLGVIADPFGPRHPWIGWQRRLGECRDVRRLAQQVGRRRTAFADRAVDAARRILDADRLAAARLDVLLGPAEARQDIADLAGHEVAAVELRRDVDGQPELRPRRLHPRRVGDGPQEIATEPDEGVHRAIKDTLARLDGVQALGPRRLDAGRVPELVERG